MRDAEIWGRKRKGKWDSCVAQWWEEETPRDIPRERRKERRHLGLTAL
jgi:hypothetical protein